VAAVAGTVTTIWVADTELTLAATPLNVTVLLAASVLKFLPVIVTTSLGNPFAGTNVLMVTGTSGLTGGLGCDFEQDSIKIEKAEIITKFKIAFAG
jgi:hypothetical protein